MAILSAQSLFSDNQAIVDDVASENYYERRPSGTPVGGAAPIDADLGSAGVPFFFQVTEDFNNLNNLEVRFEQDNDPGFGTPTLIYSETIPLSDLKAGRKFAVRTVPHGVTQRYLRFFYNVMGTAPTTGRVTAGFGMQEDSFGTR